ncbi:MAG: glyoxalase [Alphaproteobacteria bacterium]|nr:glyoxalase [Alphaproteobacteria bacterium]MBU1515176.1 glyoxalase [Alphaproteobacteria bacterium]MBU2092306.1 glyoxalase [Alphaproteobacteria bacterium]MBU2152900.1 glyoxalase [Alphaproteobacteria bacterium]MBU2305731.1 glyoxalase [Alphaproteobacteria bacterium]
MSHVEPESQPAGQPIAMSLELILIPVTDVERAKRFYGSLGWRLDIDFAKDAGYRLIQFTPPGSAGSIMFGDGLTTAEPGSLQGLHLIVSDLELARADLLRRGVKVGQPFHDLGGVFHHADEALLKDGPNPERKSYASYAAFKDPDGNSWVMQEVTARLTGPPAPGDTRFTPELTAAARGA